MIQECTQGADTCYTLTATKSSGAVFYNLGCGYSDPSGCTCTEGIACDGELDCCDEDNCNSKGWEYFLELYLWWKQRGAGWWFKCNRITTTLVQNLVTCLIILLFISAYVHHRWNYLWRLAEGEIEIEKPTPKPSTEPQDVVIKTDSPDDTNKNFTVDDTDKDNNNKSRYTASAVR